MATTTFTPSMLRGAGTRGIPEIPAGSSFSNTYSLAFDGTDDYVDTNSYDLDATNGLTLSFWIKYDQASVTGLNWVCSRGGTGGTNSQFNTRLVADGRWFNYFQGGAGYTGITGLSDDNWHHLVQTVNYTTGDVKFYKDSVISSTVLTWGSTYNTATLSVIGGANTTPAYPYTGNVDNFSIFESIQDVNVLWNDGSPGDITSLNPTLWYQFNAGSGTTAIDSGTAGNNGTINGATYQTDVPT